MQADRPSTPNSAALNQDGHDLSYFVQARVGTNKQDMWMLLDTGGSYTWVFGSNCTVKACEQHSTFDAGGDDAEIANTQWRVGYGTGTVKGTLASDVISIAGTDMTVNMTFGLATSASDDFLSYPFDGILGLAPSSSSSSNDRQSSSTFMDSVSQGRLLETNVLGFSISRAIDGAKDGEITFGGVDQSKFSGKIAYTDTVTDGEHGRLWTIPLDDAIVNGKPLNFSPRNAIIDTGTSYIMTPDAEALHDAIPGATPKSQDDDGDDDGYYLVPCDSQVDVQLVISGIAYSISPADYVGASSSSAAGTCTSTIVGQKTFGDHDWLVGDTFLKNVYTVFDYERNRVGLAPRGEGGSTGDMSGFEAESSSTSTLSVASTTTLTKSSPTSLPTPTSTGRGSASSPSTMGKATSAASRSFYHDSHPLMLGIVVVTTLMIYLHV